MERGFFYCRIAIIFLLLIFSGCNNSSHRHTDKTVFRYNEPLGITSLDPAFASTESNIRACMQLYNGLVQADSSLKIRPCIARSWEISEKGKRFVFHLRTDVYFHENNSFEIKEEFGAFHSREIPIRMTRKVTAADFVYSLKRLADPQVASPCRWVVNYVKRDSTGSLTGLEAPDDSTLIITLDRSFTPFLSILSMVCCSVVPFEVADYFGYDFRTHPCGTGPFLFRMWKQDVNLVLLKNENYFEKNRAGQQLPFLDAIEISFIQEKEKAFIEFLKGELDVINGIDGVIRNQLLTHTGQLQPRFAGKFQFDLFPYLNTEFLSIVLDKENADPEKNPLADLRIRKALSYGFYRKNLGRYLYGNIGVPGRDGIVPPGLPSFDSSVVVGYYYYPSKVASVLKEAGYNEADSFPEIILHSNVEALDLCEYIASQWEEFGFKIKVEVHSHNEQMKMIDEGKLGFFRSSWIADYPDAENFLGLFYSGHIPPNGYNFTHFSNKDYDDIYEKAMQETDDSARYVLYRYMDQLLMENAPVIIVYYDQSVRLTGPNISGISTNSMNHLILKEARKN